MKTMRAFSLLLPWLAATISLLPSATAGAATTRLLDGSVVTIELVNPIAVPIGRGSAAPSLFGGGMHYSVVQPDGKVWAGMLAGTQGSAFGDASIAQNPVTSEVFAVFGQHVTGGSSIVFASWTGQTWTEPETMAFTDAHGSNPVLAFGQAGNAVLSWQHDGLLPSLYVRHFELAPSGPVATYSFSDLGQPAALLRPASGPTGLRPGVSHSLVDSGRRLAYVFLANQSRDETGLVRLNLDELLQGGGFNAPPVPVSLSIAVTQSAGTAGTIGERTGESGVLLDPWRLVLTPEVVAYYWLEVDRLALVVFRSEVGGQIVSLPRPASDELVHALAYQTALREVARLDRRVGERPPSRRK